MFQLCDLVVEQTRLNVLVNLDQQLPWCEMGGKVERGWFHWPRRVRRFEADLTEPCIKPFLDQSTTGLGIGDCHELDSLSEPIADGVSREFFDQNPGWWDAGDNRQRPAGDLPQRHQATGDLFDHDHLTRVRESLFTGERGLRNEHVDLINRDDGRPGESEKA
ncbi:hypothetical protein [Streptosporangium subroseum]|uniref:hypothetical protein n=1 Tax=Streptosporangium subroseum TaxID=106412 RepID=UPI00308EB6CE|nr:hypothetical protein OHB15_50180 [Streptosporangium subroseum]